MDDLERFFLQPKQSLHRRYEVLRALCVEKLAAKEVARRFGYSIHTVNAMKRDFAQAARAGEYPPFFLSTTPGRNPREDRDELREEIIALMKTGSKQVYIAKRYGTSQPNLYNWIRKHDLAGIKPEY